MKDEDKITEYQKEVESLLQGAFQEEEVPEPVKKRLQERFVAFRERVKQEQKEAEKRGGFFQRGHSDTFQTAWSGHL